MKINHPIIFLLSLSFFISNSFAQLRVVYPNINQMGENTFGFAVLKLALENSGIEYELTVSKTIANNERIRHMLLDKEISISDFGTCPQFEEILQPIYFPIDMGLNGWRIFLVHNENLQNFKDFKTINDLQSLKAGQGVGWADAEILENAGLHVEKASLLSSLFAMTERKRFDYFPLGANEVHSLLDQYKQHCPNVQVEENLVLIYPFGRLFFVHKDNNELHDAVYSGLLKSFENGSFWELFKNHKSNQALFTKVNLENRVQIHINNPHMTANFKNIPEKYFFKLEMLD
jgi:hypothetical protein